MVYFNEEVDVLEFFDLEFYDLASFSSVISFTLDNWFGSCVQVEAMVNHGMIDRGYTFCGPGKHIFVGSWEVSEYFFLLIDQLSFEPVFALQLVGIKANLYSVLIGLWFRSVVVLGVEIHVEFFVTLLLTCRLWLLYWLIHGSVKALLSFLDYVHALKSTIACHSLVCLISFTPTRVGRGAVSGKFTKWPSSCAASTKNGTVLRWAIHNMEGHQMVIRFCSNHNFNILRDWTVAHWMCGWWFFPCWCCKKCPSSQWRLWRRCLLLIRYPLRPGWLRH